jgi:hypothetical protein
MGFVALLLRVVVFPFKLLFLIVANIRLTDPDPKHWPPSEIGAYAVASAVPDAAAKLCYYRMRSEHKKYDKTLHVWRAGGLRLRSTPFFVLRRFGLALYRAAVLAGLVVAGLWLFAWPLRAINLGLGPLLRQKSDTLFQAHAWLLHENPMVATAYHYALRHLSVANPVDNPSITYNVLVVLGIGLAWLMVLLLLLRLTGTAAAWLGMAAWTLLYPSVEDRWLSAMQRRERQHSADLLALAGDVPEAKPVGPTAPHDDD